MFHFGQNIQLCRSKEPLGQNRLRGQNWLLEEEKITIDNNW